MNKYVGALCSFSVWFLLLANLTLVAQTKTYLTSGLVNYMYKTKTEALSKKKQNSIFIGIEVDRYLNYHYALTTGAIYFQGGYDNGPSQWQNHFIQVPLGIKAASLGDVIGITAGINFNYLVKSTLREVCDTLNNYVNTDVTKAFHKIQPDFFFGIIIRLKRISLGIKPSFSLTDRFSTEVKTITDKNACYYGSWYAYVLPKDSSKLKASAFQFSLSVRLF
jgi:hypothetical protein